MIERQVAVVTDSGTSMRPGGFEARSLGVTVVPLDINLWKNGEYVTIPDDKISSEEFYKQMEESERPPQSSGAITGPLTDVYKKLVVQNKAVISIHITSKHSAVYDSAILAKNIITGERAVETPIDVIDSKSVSIAAWFPVKVAAELAAKRVSAKTIKEEVDEVISNSQILVTLETFDNLIKGGRGSDIMKAKIASVLNVYPIIGFDNGRLKNIELARSVNKSRERMVEIVGSTKNLARVAVMHTNAPSLAMEIKEKLRPIFPGDIPIYEGGPVLAIHAGKRAIAIAYQKA